MITEYDGRTASVDVRGLRKAQAGLAYLGFSNGCDVAWFDVKRIRRMLQSSKPLPGFRCHVRFDGINSLLIFSWRDGRGGVRLRSQSPHDARHAERLFERRLAKAIQKCKPVPRPVTKIVAVPATESRAA